MPPDFPFAEILDPVVRVQNKPQKVLHKNHPYVKSQQQGFQTPRPRHEEQRQVDNGNQEYRHEEVIAGQRSAAGQFHHPALFDTPSWGFRRPTVLPLNLYLPQRQDERQENQKHQQPDYHLIPIYQPDVIIKTVACQIGSDNLNLFRI